MDNGLTKRQIEVLRLIAPYPMGEGLTYKQATERLGVSSKAIEQIIHTIKNKCPRAYEALKIARRRAAETRLQLSKTIELNNALYNESKIRQQF